MGRKVTEERGLRRFIKRKKTTLKCGWQVGDNHLLCPFSLVKGERGETGFGPVAELPVEVWRETLTRERNRG